MGIGKKIYDLIWLDAMASERWKREERIKMIDDLVRIEAEKAYLLGLEMGLSQREQTDTTNNANRDKNRSHI